MQTVELLIFFFCLRLVCILQLISCFKLIFLFYKISALVKRFSDSCIVLYYSGNKGFHFSLIFFPQNFEDFSIHITYRLYQKAKQLEDDTSKGGSRTKPRGGGGGGKFFFHSPPPLSQGFRKCYSSPP